MDWSNKLWESQSPENCSAHFFTSVLRCLNDSVIGPTRVEKFNGTSIFSSLSNIEQCLIVIPILIAVTIKNYFSNRDGPNEKNKVTLSWPQFINPKTFFIAFSFVVLTVLLPVIILTLALAFVNRQIVDVLLRVKYGRRYVKLLCGTDTIWALEEDNARSIINVITTIEVETNKTCTEKGKIVNLLRETIKKKFFTGNSPYPKMFYKRSIEKGYFFWEKNEKLCIDDFVRCMNLAEDVEMNNDTLHKFVSENANRQLPLNNTAAWEVLISEKPMAKHEGDKPDIEIYPLLFRIHHSLGDGVVLMKLLLKTIADESIETQPVRKNMSVRLSFKSLLSFEKIQRILRVKDIYKYVFNCITKMTLIILAPASLISQFLRPPDNNALHGTPLNGKKVCAWVSDGLDEESLLVKIKRIKSRIPAVTFSDVFLTGLSSSCNTYFTQCCVLGKPTIPEYITAVVPVRVEKSDLTLKAEISDSKLKLVNRFSVAMLTVPIILADSVDCKNFSLLRRLVEVRKQTSRLRYSADYYVNYWIMSVASHVLPEPILRPILYSEQATLVVSNLPGPTNIKICGGYVRDMAFFVPNRGTTGMGVTLLTCGGRLHLGLMADSSLISCTEDAETILKGTVEEIKALDVFTSRRMYSQENYLEFHD